MHSSQASTPNPAGGTYSTPRDSVVGRQGLATLSPRTLPPLLALGILPPQDKFLAMPEGSASMKKLKNTALMH